MHAHILDVEGVSIAVTGPDSSYRPYPRQQYYWALFQSGQGNQAAFPGTSNHGMGINVDVPQYVRTLIDKYGAAFGWSKSWSDAPNEWWHITYQTGHYTGHDPGPSGHTAPTYPTLKLGADGGAVKRAQKHLRRWNVGISRPHSDGGFGEMTRRAVVEFQITHGLKPHDGVIGVKTWAALRRNDPLFADERLRVNRLRLERSQAKQNDHDLQTWSSWCAKRAGAIKAVADKKGWDDDHRRERFDTLKQAAGAAYN